MSIRALFLVLLPVLTLVGCSVAELERIATEGDSLSGNPPIHLGGNAGLGQERDGEAEPLIPVRMIYGGQQDVAGMRGRFRRLAAGAVEEIVLGRPVAVGGVDNLLYIVDAEQKIVFVYDLDTRLFRPTIEIGQHLRGEPGAIYVARDRSFYLVDMLGKQVLHFAENGSVLTRFQDLANLSRPVAVTVDEMSGNVFVADGSYSHVVVFNAFGKAIRAIGRRGSGPGRLRAITALATGNDGLYVLDRLELPVQVFTWEGAYRYAFGEGELTFPIAAVVDEEERVYISDESDNVLRIYQEGRLQHRYGGTGATPGRFRKASGLWLHRDLLYVADSLNRRVQVLRIAQAARPADAIDEADLP